MPPRAFHTSLDTRSRERFTQLPRRDARPDILTGGLSAILASSCCLGPPVRSAYKLLFWIVAALVVVALGFPYVLPFFY